MAKTAPERFIMVLAGSVPAWPSVALVHLPKGTKWVDAMRSVNKILRACNNGKPVKAGDWFVDPAPGDVDHGSDAEILEGQRSFFNRTKVAQRFVYVDGEIRKVC